MNDLAPIEATPLKQMESAHLVVKALGNLKHLIVNIQGRDYPTVAWWQAVGWAFNVTSTEISVSRITTEDGSIEYAAIVAVVNRSTGIEIARGSAIASSTENAPWSRKAFSIRSMAITRATGRAYRHSCSIVPHILKMESTPVEEMTDTTTVPALPAASTEAAYVTTNLRASWMEEQIGATMLRLAAICSVLGKTIDPVKERKAAEKGTTNLHEVLDKLEAKVAAGEKKIAEQQKEIEQ